MLVILFGFKTASAIYKPTNIMNIIQLIKPMIVTRMLRILALLEFFWISCKDSSFEIGISRTNIEKNNGKNGTPAGNQQPQHQKLKLILSKQ